MKGSLNEKLEAAAAVAVILGNSVVWTCNNHCTATSVPWQCQLRDRYL